MKASHTLLPALYMSIHVFSIAIWYRIHSTAVPGCHLQQFIRGSRRLHTVLSCEARIERKARKQSCITTLWLPASERLVIFSHTQQALPEYSALHIRTAAKLQAQALHLSAWLNVVWCAMINLPMALLCSSHGMHGWAKPILLWKWSGFFSGVQPRLSFCGWKCLRLKDLVWYASFLVGRELRGGASHYLKNMCPPFFRLSLSPILGDGEETSGEEDTF